MSDRNGGLIAAARTLSIKLHYCTVHIIRNIRSHFSSTTSNPEGKRFTKDAEGIIWEMQKTLEEAVYRSELCKLEIQCGRTVRDYVEQIDPAKWTVHANVGKTKLYGWRTTNFVESENSTSNTLGIRDKLPYPFIEALVEFIREDFVQKREDIKKWRQEGRVITPNAGEHYIQQTRELRIYQCDKVTDDILHVYRMDVLPYYKRRVVLSKKECSCGFFDQFGIPCRHFVAALARVGQEKHVFDYFDDIYKVEEYAKAFGDKFLLPPLHDEVDEDDILPCPPPRPKPGPAVSRRIASAGEVGATKVHRRRCSLCSQYGHIRSSCPSRARAPDVDFEVALHSE